MSDKLWSERQSAEWRTKVGLAEMLKGGVIMDVTNAEQAKIAEKAGAVAVMALERVPADIRSMGGVARMSDPKIIKEIQTAVSIPVMAKCRIGHFVEAKILEALEVDFIDESEVLTPADDRYHVNKHAFKVPFVCGCRDLGEALRRIGEGAAMIRTKGEPGTGDVIEAVRHMRSVTDEIARLSHLRDEESMTAAKDLGAPYELVVEVARTGKLPVPNFSAGGIATPADDSSYDGTRCRDRLRRFGHFQVRGSLPSSDGNRRGGHLFQGRKKLAQLSEDLGEPMVGIGFDELREDQHMAKGVGEG